jgi:hypothetical protein
VATDDRPTKLDSFFIISEEARSETTMDDELRQVKDDIRDTRADLAAAEDKGDRVFIKIYGNLLLRLYEEEARVEARLSAGEIHYNRGVCDIVRFLSI